MAESLHIGRKISRVRELRGIKQEMLAEELGVSQQKISKIEHDEKVEEEMLSRIAKALGVTPDVIKNFSEESAIYHIQNIDKIGSYAYSFNPIDKILQLYDEKVQLLNALLKEKDDKIAMLERLEEKMNT